ncbi:MAG: hypothetical protein BECKG1743F_GA0114225_102873 [Candidatus Kentron sp. G]|nr:MAG: hypothetical protein BECKG1743F_GA0114225_102873 [Candidatus Kentron sp. G]VFN01180.1 MAG: hypothetical protein BECKG1743E_GA0114224_103873 [Candidatus Kentron sp. G]
MDGQAKPVTFTVRNTGQGRVFWIDVVQRRGTRRMPVSALGEPHRSNSMPNDGVRNTVRGAARDTVHDAVRDAVHDAVRPGGLTSILQEPDFHGGGARLLFHPPPTQVILEPGESVELTGHVSFHSDYEFPEGGEETLHLAITSAHGEPIPLAIPVVAHTPQLALRAAVWQSGLDGWQWLRGKLSPIFEDAALESGAPGQQAASIAVALANPGEQELAETEFSLRVSGLAADLDTIARNAAPPGPLGDLNFALPAGFVPNEDTRITLEAFQLGPPAHR